MAILKNTTISDTGSIVLPLGTTAQRPASPASGQIRYNTTLAETEYYDGSAWRPVSDNNLEATGGIITDTVISGVPYRIHLFTNTGNTNFVVTRAGEIEYLVVGGGGGGGNTSDSGGGGSGGVVFGITNVTPSTYTVTVGAGGARGVNGSSSSIAGIAAAGGGFSASASFGGSSGSPQSNPGGAGGGSNSEGGGGGGAGGPGQNATDASSYPGQGGPGLFFGNFVNYIGDNGWVASGGGGGGERTAPLRVPGGGGVGGVPTTQLDRDAIPNTGGGGGGNRDDGAAGGNAARNAGAGGSGVVVIRYRRNSESTTPTRTVITTQPYNYQTFKNNLVLHLDAANPLSYPGNGTTWFDLTGNGNHAYGQGGGGATVDNSRFPQFQNNDGGRFNFDGNTSFLIPTNMGDHVSSTHEMWFYKNSANEMYIADARNGTGSWWITDYQSNDNIDIHGQLEADDPIPHSNVSNWWFRWTHVVIMSNATASRLFINGNEVLAPNLKRSNPLNVNLGANFSIGARFTTSGRWFGYFSVYKIYNRELTVSEVQQSFNSTRSRYGI